MAIPSPARIEPLPDDAWPEEFDNPKILKVNVIATLAKHNDLFKSWNRFAGYILNRTEITKREVEILILRTGWNRQSDYEWGQHAIIGRRAGITDDELIAIAKGPTEASWSAKERNLLVAADELYADSEISDATWAALALDYSENQLMDIIMVVGQYSLVCMFLKSVRVQLDEGVDGLPSV